ncbi:MAG: lipopolysaccharide kinase InaA family protein [Candidatus Gracilibacteria bacterium]|nr:lipopolysaccharide kinase InaA family protein [Candidatus Gracilibacteria bacterium]
MQLHRNKTSKKEVKKVELDQKKPEEVDSITQDLAEIQRKGAENKTLEAVKKAEREVQVEQELAEMAKIRAKKNAEQTREQVVELVVEDSAPKEAQESSSHESSTNQAEDSNGDVPLDNEDYDDEEIMSADDQEIILDELEFLGKGAVAEVYRGRELRKNRSYIKKIAQKASLSRFIEREVEVRQAINGSEGFAGLIQHGVDEDDKAYALYEMPETYVPIASVLEALSEEQKESVINQLALRIQTMHRAGYLHNDLSLDVLFVQVNKDGTVDLMLSDFTQSISLAEAEEEAKETLQASLLSIANADDMGLGKLAYMTPDRKRGLYKDEKAEVQAFSYLAYEILKGKGQVPLDHEDWDEFRKSHNIKGVIYRASRKRKDRYNNMDEVLAGDMSDEYLKTINEVQKKGQSFSREKYQAFCSTLLEDGRAYGAALVNKMLDEEESPEVRTILIRTLIAFGKKIPRGEISENEAEIFIRIQHLHKEVYKKSEEEIKEIIQELTQYLIQGSEKVQARTVDLILGGNKSAFKDSYIHQNALDIMYDSTDAEVWGPTWRNHFYQYKDKVHNSFIFEPNHEEQDLKLFVHMLSFGVAGHHGYEKFYIMKYKAKIISLLNIETNGASYWEGMTSDISKWIKQKALRESVFDEKGEIVETGDFSPEELIDLLESATNPCNPDINASLQYSVFKSLMAVEDFPVNLEERMAQVLCDLLNKIHDYDNNKLKESIENAQPVRNMKAELCILFGEIISSPKIRTMLMNQVKDEHKNTNSATKKRLTSFSINEWNDRIKTLGFQFEESDYPGFEDLVSRVISDRKSTLKPQLCEIIGEYMGNERSTVDQKRSLLQMLNKLNPEKPFLLGLEWEKDDIYKVYRHFGMYDLAIKMKGQESLENDFYGPGLDGIWNDIVKAAESECKKEAKGLLGRVSGLRFGKHILRVPTNTEHFPMLTKLLKQINKSIDSSIPKGKISVSSMLASCKQRRNFYNNHAKIIKRIFSLVQSVEWPQEEFNDEYYSFAQAAQSFMQTIIELLKSFNSRNSTTEMIPKGSLEYLKIDSVKDALRSYTNKWSKASRKTSKR